MRKGKDLLLSAIILITDLVEVLDIGANAVTELRMQHTMTDLNIIYYSIYIQNLLQF